MHLNTSKFLVKFNLEKNQFKQKNKIKKDIYNCTLWHKTSSITINRSGSATMWQNHFYLECF